MRALIARDLADAAIAALSADRRFATAHNAAQDRQSQNRVRECPARLSATACKHADYFETCGARATRSIIRTPHVATETEAKEILKKATEY